MSFDSLGLRPEILEAVADQGYTEPTPIQHQVIPEVLNGRDVMGGSQTGTGKTAGFTLPILQRLMEASKPDGKRPVRALILTPTRELAVQVAESVHIYGKYLPLRSTVVYGGVGLHPQIAKLNKGVDIVVATPGRLLDHAEHKNIDLSRVQVLVLDEADRMLDMGFIPDVRRILRLLPRDRQNLLFSATLPPEIRMLAQDFLKNPVTVQVAPHNTAAEQVDQKVYPVDRSRKRTLLVKLLKEGDWRQVLMFVNMKVDAGSMARQLQREGINAGAIHGDRTQAKRTQVLENFKRGKVHVLVATDVASRGLDIDQLPHVVNFELPHVPGDYIHRIGRTGRAGNPGEAISLVSPEEDTLLRNIERLLGLEIPKVIVPEFAPDPNLTRRVIKARSRMAPIPIGNLDAVADEPVRKHWSKR
ncbi:MAG: DEAD/DEAH box helicase [Gammaproteobacteria bacterium]|nr:DEAD/DEAH box helicase [Gammaproteobacteria bacterium]